MDEKELMELAKAMLEKLPPIKTESDLNIFSRALKKIAVEKALASCHTFYVRKNV